MTDTDKTKTKETPEKKFSVQKIYSKKSIFELAEAGDIQIKEWKPQVRVELDTRHKKLQDDLFETTLELRLIVSASDTRLFEIKYQQAGAFVITNFSEDEKEQLLGINCFHIIYPYACEAIANMVNRSGFPPIYLTPIDFQSMYQQRKERKDKKDTKDKIETAEKQFGDTAVVV